MLSARVGGLELVIQNMNRIESFTNEIKPAILEAAGAVLHANVKTNISLRDHSLRDLKNLDHPYAKRHGTIQIHNSGGSGIIRDPSAQVHSQSGDMLGALKSDMFSIHKWVLWFDLDAAPHALTVATGKNSPMLPRNILEETAMASGTQKGMMKAVVQTIGPKFKTQAGIRFRAVSGASGTSI